MQNSVKEVERQLMSNWEDACHMPLGVILDFWGLSRLFEVSGRQRHQGLRRPLRGRWELFDPGAAAIWGTYQGALGGTPWGRGELWPPRWTRRRDCSFGGGPRYATEQACVGAWGRPWRLKFVMRPPGYLSVVVEAGSFRAGATARRLECSRGHDQVGVSAVSDGAGWPVPPPPSLLILSRSVFRSCVMTGGGNPFIDLAAQESCFPWRVSLGFNHRWLCKQ